MYYWVIRHDVEDNVFHECIIHVVINTWWGLAGYGLLGSILASRCKFINLVNSKLSYLDLFLLLLTFDFIILNTFIQVSCRAVDIFENHGDPELVWNMLWLISFFLKMVLRTSLKIEHHETCKESWKMLVELSAQELASLVVLSWWIRKWSKTR